MISLLSNLTMLIEEVAAAVVTCHPTSLPKISTEVKAMTTRGIIVINSMSSQRTRIGVLQGEAEVTNALIMIDGLMTSIHRCKNSILICQEEEVHATKSTMTKLVTPRAVVIAGNLNLIKPTHTNESRLRSGSAQRMMSTSSQRRTPTPTVTYLLRRRYQMQMSHVVQRL